MNSTEQPILIADLSSTQDICESPVALNKTQAKRRMTSLSRKIEATKATLDSLYAELSHLRAEFPEPEEKPKGRPKKPSAKASTADSETEDLFAKMVSDNMSSPSTILDVIAEDETAEEPTQEKKKKAPLDPIAKHIMVQERKEYLAEVKKQALAAKAAALEEAKAAKLAALEEAKAAKLAALEEAKEAKAAKAAALEQEKVTKLAEKKAALEQEKAAKAAALEEAKAAKLAEKKAALEQEKAAKKAALDEEKAAKKAALEQEKAAKKAPVKEKAVAKEKAPVKEKAPTKAEKAEKEEHDSRACPAFVEPAPVKVTVTWAVIDNIKYLKSASGVLYNPDTKEAIGTHDEETNTINPLPEEDADESDEEMVEEEYDDSSN